MTTATTPTVPVGPTTIVGYGGTVVGLIASVLVLIFPDGDEQTIALIASAVFTLGSFLVTQIGRYVQAKELAKRTPIVRAVGGNIIMAGSGGGTKVVAPADAPPSPVDPDRPRDPAVDLVGGEDLPSGAEEAAAAPPEDDSAVPDNPDNGER